MDGLFFFGGFVVAFAYIVAANYVYFCKVLPTLSTQGSDATYKIWHSEQKDQFIRAEEILYQQGNRRGGPPLRGG